MKNNYGHWICLSFQFLDTSKAIIEETISSKNKWCIISDNPIDFDDYFEKTKWSDFNTLVPSIFLFLHGTELLMKGLISYYNSDVKFDHNSNKFIALLKSNNIDIDLISILEKYVGENPSNRIIKEFIDINNNITPNKLHIDIRYPQNTKGEIIETDFSPFRYQTTSILPELKDIVLDIDTIKEKSLSIIRN